MANSDHYDWDSFWAHFKVATNAEALVKIATALNQAGPFREWVLSRSDRVQVEVLAGAPIEILLGYRDAIAPKALVKIASLRSKPDAEALGVQQEKIK